MTAVSVKLQNVQALRAVAALAVVLAHIGDPDGIENSWLQGEHRWLTAFDRPGNAGVDLFFVISGLIMFVTTSRLAAGAAGSRRFLVRRATRIYPAYWVATLPALMLFLIAPSMVNSSQEHAPRIFESLLLLPQSGLPLLLVGWTLTFELYFYLVFALTLLAPARLRLPLLIAWGMLTATLAVVLADSVNPWLGLISAPICLEFLFGAVVGWLVVSGRFLFPTAAAIVGGLSLGLAVWIGGDNFPGDWYRVVPAGALIAVFVYGMVGLEARGGYVAPRWLQKLGDASYSMYLWHVLILAGLGRFLLIRLPDNPVAHAVGLALAIGAVLIGSLLAYRFVEQPLLRLSRNGRSGRTPAVAARGRHRTQVPNKAD
ncbi:acyltransferase family protein [Nakamurella sp. GG22]